jgi:excisionase family DNA binding protein
MESAPLAYTVVEAVKASGIGRSKLYTFIQDGRLPIRKCGRRTLITRKDLEALIESLPVGDEAAR